MANTNAFVEKLKALGIRHGEKAVVGVAGGLFVMFVVSSFSQEAIKLTPDEVQTHAKKARANLDEKQDPKFIGGKLETDGIKLAGFEGQVKDIDSKSTDTTEYALSNPWVTVPPGAGNVRATPLILAVTELYSSASQGGAVMYKVDENGERIPLDEKDLAVAKPKPRRKRSNPMGGRGMMGGMGGAPKKGSSKTARDAAKAKAQRQEENLKAELAGDVEDESKAEAVEVEYKQTVKGLRWIAVTGVVDNQKMIDNFSKATKIPGFHPHYIRLNVQRQELGTDNTWGEWTKVDSEANITVLENMPDYDEEKTPENVRLSALVDPLPLLRTGHWRQVHIARLVPKDKRTVAKNAAAGGGGGMGVASNPMMDNMLQQQAGYGNKMGSQMSNMSKSGDMMNKMMGGNRMSGLGKPGGGGGAGGIGGIGGGQASKPGGTGDGEYEKSDQKEIMIRSLDFTIEPDKVYRYRVQLVVWNPNYKFDNVLPGVDTKSKTLTGPWSDASQPTLVPPEVMVHLVKKPPATSDPTGDPLRFQLTRWNPEDGLSVVKEFEIRLGDAVGWLQRVPVPAVEVNPTPGANPKISSKPIDFNSGQLMLDEIGGSITATALRSDVAPINVPAYAVLLLADGRLAIHDQTVDSVDPSRKSAAADFKDAVTHRRKRKAAGGMGAMMGGRGGGGGAGLSGASN